MRNTQSKRQNTTRSTTETRLYAVGTAELGNASEIVMWKLTHSVRSVLKADFLCQPKRCITKSLSQKVERIAVQILFLFVNPVTHVFTQSVVTVGTTPGRAVAISGTFIRATGWGWRAHFLLFKRGINPRSPVLTIFHSKRSKKYG